MTIDQDPKIGFAGLGALGGALVSRLAAQGIELAVWNRSPEKSRALASRELASKAIRVAPDLHDLVAQSDWLFSCVADDVAFDRINSKILACPQPPVFHVSFSSCSPDAVRVAAAKLGEHGVTLVNSPVMGRPDIVAAGKAGLLVSGPGHATNAVMPILDLLGMPPSYLGADAERSAIVKLAINYFVAVTIAGLSEAFAVLARQGLASELFLEVISKSPISSPILQLFGIEIINRGYDKILFDLRLARKDMGYFLASEPAVSGLFVADAVVKHMEKSLESAPEPIDWAGLAHHLF